MRRWLRWFWLPLPAGLLLVALLISAGFYGYHRLTAEALVAEVHFAQLGDQLYQASFADADGCDSREFMIHGDQWRVDARFVKWKYWASLLGLDPLYRLERLEGRYRSTQQQNSHPRLAHDLGERAAIDLLQGLEAMGRYNLLFDASYGSSSYVEIDPSLRYRLYRSQTGLLIRSEPLEEVALTQDGLTITISHACGDRSSLWRRLASGLNRWLVADRSP